MIKVNLKCDSCGEEFEQHIDYISQVDWVCPKCKYSEDTYLMSYDDPEADDTPLVMGRGGCRQK